MYGNSVNIVMFQSFADPSLAADPAKDKQFAEKEIDAMRAKKDEVSCYFSLSLSVMLSLVHLNNDPSENHRLIFIGVCIGCGWAFSCYSICKLEVQNIKVQNTEVLL